MQPLRLHPPFAAGAVPGVGTAVVMLRGLEERQHRVPPPRIVTGQRRPAVVVLALAAHVDHPVDRRAAAQHAAARIPQRTAVQARLGLRAIQPVSARVADAIQVADGDVDPVIVVLAAGLQQQHRHLRIQRQAISQDAARRARADDDVVVGLHVSCLLLGVLFLSDRRWPGSPGLRSARPATPASSRTLHRASARPR